LERLERCERFTELLTRREIFDGDLDQPLDSTRRGCALGGNSVVQADFDRFNAVCCDQCGGHVNEFEIGRRQAIDGRITLYRQPWRIAADQKQRKLSVQSC